MLRCSQEARVRLRGFFAVWVLKDEQDPDDRGRLRPSAGGNQAPERSIARPAVIRAIAEAREHGDLSENAEYHAARERQSFIEGRLAELEDKVGRAEVIDVSKLSGSLVKFGATVTLADEETEEEQPTRSSARTRPTSRRSASPVTSPLARALIGKSAATASRSRPRAAPSTYEISKVAFKK